MKKGTPLDFLATPCTHLKRIWPKSQGPRISKFCASFIFSSLGTVASVLSFQTPTSTTSETTSTTTTTTTISPITKTTTTATSTSTSPQTNGQVTIELMDITTNEQMDKRTYRQKDKRTNEKTETKLGQLNTAFSSV